MNKVVKYSLISLGSALALIAAFIISIPLLFNLNDYKSQVEAIVLDTTGRTLTIDGDIDYAVFPVLGVEANKVTFSNAAGFGNEPMAYVARVKIGVMLMPLLSGEIKFRHVTIEGASVYLGRNAEGVFNWDDLVGNSKSKSEQADQPTEGMALSFSVKGVTVKDSEFTWADHKADFVTSLANINAKLGDVSTVSTFPVKASFTYVISRPELKGNVEVEGKAAIDLDNLIFGAEGLKVNLLAEGEAMPSGKIEAETSLAKGLFDVNGDRITVSDLITTAYGVTAEADGEVEAMFAGDVKAKASVKTAPFDVGKTLASLGVVVPKMTDPEALRSLGYSFQAIYSKSSIRAKDIQAELDGCTIGGRVRVKFGKVPFCFARLDVGNLDLDRYLPPANADASESKGKTNEPLYDVEMLRKLHVDGEARVSSLLVKKIKMERVKVAVLAKDGLIKISPVSLDLYGGSVGAALRVDARKSLPLTEAGVKLKKIDLGGLMQDMSGNEAVAGVLNLEAAVTTAGNDVDAMMKGLNGAAKFDLADGVFPGVDLSNLAQQTQENKSKSGKIEAQKEDSTKFGQMSGSCTITNGVVFNEDLDVRAPGLRAAGHGGVSLISKDIDYIVRVKVVASRKGQGGTAAKDAYGVMVPVRVGGTYDEPIYWVSIPEYLKALAGVALDITGGAFDLTGDVVKGVGKGAGSVVKGIGSLIPGFGDDKDKETEKK